MDIPGAILLRKRHEGISMIRQIDAQEYPIPGKLNIAITLLLLPITWVLLWMASHLAWSWALLAAFLFAHFNNTAFAMLHEAVHGVYSRNQITNEFFGVICAALLPTSFRLQQIAHLAHHQSNRTDLDLYDYCLPGQSRWQRNFQLYAGNLMGLYWLCIPLSNMIFLLMPWLYRSRWFIEGPARFLGFEAYIREIVRHGFWRIWLECLWALVYQLTIWFLLDLNWGGLLLCYGAFALHWSALQYVNHAWSPRDVIEGAWNLRVSKPFRWLALNYHCHLTHHRFPQIPWMFLPRMGKKEDQRQPSFWQIYFSLWRGVRPAPEMGSPARI